MALEALEEADAEELVEAEAGRFGGARATTVSSG